MKEWNSSRLCRLYLVLISTVFPLSVSPAGYENIAETKFAVFVLISALFLLFRLLSGLRGGMHRASVPGQGPVSLLILCFWAWSLLSALVSPWRITALIGGPRQDGMITLTLYCAVFLFLSSEGGLRIRRSFLCAAAVTALILCGIAALQFLDRNPLGLYPGTFRWSGRETEYNGAFLSTLGNADLAAAVLAMAFAFFWSYALLERCRWFLIPAAACLITLLLAGIRGGILAAACGLLICLPAQLPLKKQSRLCLYAAIGVILLSSLVLLRFLPEGGSLGEIKALLHGRISDSMGSGRIYIWKKVWELIGERPLFGGGPDTLVERGVSFLGVRPDGTWMRRSIDAAHNEYLNILVNQGIPAFLFYLCALVCTLWQAFRSQSREAAVLRAVLVTYSVSALFGISSPLNTAMLWICWGSLNAVLRGERRSPPSGMGASDRI